VSGLGVAGVKGVPTMKGLWMVYLGVVSGVVSGLVSGLVGYGVFD
jgi:hypothetical protein